MNRIKAMILGAGLIVCLSVGAESAHAQLFAPSYGFAGGTGPYNMYTQDTPPFYAMYPPVYYSRPVARTYGWAPFAYPPFVQTPESMISQPQGVQTSSTYDSSVPPGPSDAVAQVQPLMIENPFFRQAAK